MSRPSLGRHREGLRFFHTCVEGHSASHCLNPRQMGLEAWRPQERATTPIIPGRWQKIVGTVIPPEWLFPPLHVRWEKALPSDPSVLPSPQPPSTLYDVASPFLTYRCKGQSWEAGIIPVHLGAFKIRRTCGYHGWAGSSPTSLETETFAGCTPREH